MNPKLAFFINGIIEVIGGVVILFYPSTLLYGVTPTTEFVAASKFYALAAIVIGVFSVLIAQSFEDLSATPLNKALLLFSGFHILMSFQLYSYYQINVVTHYGPWVFHFLLGTYLTLIYLYNSPKKEL